jgi:hypothetical protein
VALALRLALLVRSGWLLEGDDALSALMALSVQHGERPIMLKNQAYAAAWQPYAMAASFTLFGVSRVAAKLPALLGSLAFVLTSWLLAREVAGAVAARLAALLAAAPPAYVLVLSLKPWAPYTEDMLFGSLALTCATRLAFPRQHHCDSAWAAGCGVACGLAFWMHPIAIFYGVPTVLIILFRVHGARLVRVIVCSLLGFGLGGLPVWIYNLQSGGATFRFVLAGMSGHTVDRLAVMGVWWNADMPRAIGLWNPWGQVPRLIGFALGTVFAGALAWAVLWRPWQRPALRPLDSVLLLLLAIPAIFVLSGFGAPALNSWSFDATGRYAPPIWSGLAVVLGALLAAVWRLRRALAVALTVTVVAANLYALASVDPVRAFQSPYWDKLPADNRPLLDTLAAEGVTHVWLNHWVAFPLMFDARASRQPLVAYDWFDVQAGGIDRFPEYFPLVEQAERPAFVLVTDEPEPELEQRLRGLGVSYLRHRVPPYVVVIPVSRKVHPSEVTSALDYRY